MLGLERQRWPSPGAAAAGERQGARKRHRARHTKSRHGCFSCKLRRVKCDEARPACGACSSRGEPCTFPDPSTIPDTTGPTRKQPARGRRTRSLQPEGSVPDQPQSPRFSEPPTEDVLAMDDLRLMQFYHLYTAPQMSLDDKRRIVWQRVVPILAAKHNYLMHLLLAVGGVHMIATQELENDTQGPETDTVGLRVIMEHYQRGLRGFREAVSQIAQLNSEAIYAGSLLLVAFTYASFQLSELDRQSVNEGLLLDFVSESQDGNVLHFRWLHLIRGVSSVICDQWGALKASRLRPLLLHFHGDEYWKDLPFAPSLTRLSRCSPRLLAFAQGSGQAIANLKAIWAAIQPPCADNPSVVDSPSSLPSSTTLDGSLNEQLRAIGFLDMIYSRINCALQCSTGEQGYPNDLDIQTNLEEAAVLSWPTMLTSDFIALLEMTNRTNPVWRHSLVILAHFYVINTLVDRWYLKGSFEREISKIFELIAVANDAKLAPLMRWPLEIVNS
ncbi:hypothetical protein BDW71DRAFT_192483 [Aspergillus fruticulosus]